MKCPGCQTEFKGGRCPECGFAAVMVPDLLDPEPEIADQKADPAKIEPQGDPPPSDWLSRANRRLQERYVRMGRPLKDQPSLAPPVKAQLQAWLDELLTMPADRVIGWLFDPEPRRKSRAQKNPLSKTEQSLQKPPPKEPTTAFSAGGQSASVAVQAKPEVHAKASVSPLTARPILTPEQTWRSQAPLVTEPEQLRPALSARLFSAAMDLLLAGAAGAILAYSAAWVLGATVFLQDFYWLGGGCAVAFFFFNSLLCLWRTGQTPGMAWRGLILKSEDESPVPFTSVLFRTFLMLPVSLTLVGLLAALADPRGRCWHDRLSKTWVAPCGTEPERTGSPTRLLDGQLP